MHINDSILHVENLWEFSSLEIFSNLAQIYFLRDLFSFFKLFRFRCGSGPVGAIIALVSGSRMRNGKKEKKEKEKKKLTLLFPFF